MYDKILLASDGSRESLTALREGALLARACGAEVFLLVVDRETPGRRVADGVYPAPLSDELQRLLERGLARLARLGVKAQGRVVTGEPAVEIGGWARAFAADLVVVGHRRRSLLDRWWSGDSGGYLVDHVPCSVLIARKVVSDEAFEARMAAEAEPADASD